MSIRISKTLEKYKLWFFIGIPIIIVGILLDMAIKDLAFWVFEVKQREPFELLKGILRFTYTENRGAAFSMLTGRRWLFILLTILALAFAIFAIVKEYVKGWFGVASLSLVLSGAIGNFIDRLIYGYVIDMFEIKLFDFAIFNVADICVVAAIICLFVYIIFIDPKIDAANKTAAEKAESDE